MNNVIEEFDLDTWDVAPRSEVQKKAIEALENGKVVYLPALPFALQENELQFLTPDIANKKAKNVSYDRRTDKFGGTDCQGEQAALLRDMMQRYAIKSKQLLDNLFPHYKPTIRQARTSYRPVEILGRVAPSYRKDDTLLHVDAFPSTPVQGERILRVFTNVNPHGQSRVWRVGEPFADVVKKFAPAVKKPFPGSAYWQKLLKITREYRTLYDHYMLNIHNTMKADRDYQKNVPQKEVHFPPGGTWFVYTDQVSHAAMSGQYVFEQTFHLPVRGLYDEKTAPLRVLEKFLNKELV